MEEIKVSVIVPVYNSEHYLHQCLDSICNQTLQEIEIILVDDESKDGSLSILESYAKQDQRIQIIHNIHQGEGAASARNAGLAAAQGQYISFLDSDDYFELDMLQKVYEKAVKTEADIVVFDGKLYDHAVDGVVDTDTILDRSKLPETEVFSNQELPDTLFIFCTPTPWAKLFKHSLIIKYALQFQPVYYTDDIAFVLQAFAMANKMTAVTENLLYYRVNHAQAQTTNKAKSPLSMVYAYLAVKEFLEIHNCFERFQNAYANAAIRECAFYLNTIKDVDSFRKLYEALAVTHREDLALETALTKDVLDFDAVGWLQAIDKNDSVAYGFLGDGYTETPLFFRYGSGKLFPNSRIPKNARIILYGAGKVGKSLYIQNVLENHCEIVAWVDRNPENKPFPVEGLTALEREKNNIEYILVSIENRATAKKVKEFLQNNGWQEETIILYLS